MASLPTPKPEILSIPAYVPGKSKGTAPGKVFKLSSNESALGPSPKALEAYRAAMTSLHRYPESTCQALREALGARHHVPQEQIICGAGSDQILELLAKTYLGPGDEAIYSHHGFLVYPMVILANGATPVVAPEVDFKTSVEAILSRVTPRTKMVFLANPNNPTGTFLTKTELETLHRNLPSHCLLVIDAAYSEYVTTADDCSGLDLAKTSDNVIMTRTFSKIYGLAALRLGWAFGAKAIIDMLHRVREPFNVSTPASLAGIGALSDPEHLQKSIAHNTLWREKLSSALRGWGVVVTPSMANFILVHFPPSFPWKKTSFEAALNARGILVRDVGAYHLPDALRISIGETEALEALLEAGDAFFATRGIAP